MEVRAGLAGLPAGGAVAAFAGTAETRFLERAAMRISVAALAPAEGQPLELGSPFACAGFMTLLARDRLMQAS